MIFFNGKCDVNDMAERCIHSCDKKKHTCKDVCIFYRDKKPDHQFDDAAYHCDKLVGGRTCSIT